VKLTSHSPTAKHFYIPCYAFWYTCWPVGDIQGRNMSPYQTPKISCVAVLFRNHCSVMLPAPVTIRPNNTTSHVEWITFRNTELANTDLLLHLTTTLGCRPSHLCFRSDRQLTAFRTSVMTPPACLQVTRALVRGGQGFRGPGSVIALCVVQLIMMQTAKWQNKLLAHCSEAFSTRTVRLAATVELFELHALGTTWFLYLYCKGKMSRQALGAWGWLLLCAQCTVRAVTLWHCI
jgi:hypothetical protein